MARTIGADKQAFAAHVKEITKPHGGELWAWGKGWIRNKYATGCANADQQVLREEGVCACCAGVGLMHRGACLFKDITTHQRGGRGVLRDRRSDLCGRRYHHAGEQYAALSEWVSR
jgi:hypothetical protein